MASKPYLMVSLEDAEAKELAQVLTNDTSRNIMKQLSTRESATETEIAQALKLPLSTVHYNIQNLVKAKLVRPVEFHYSRKGKEVLHYALSNKLIVISPSKEEHAKLLKRVLPAAITVAVAGTALHFLSGRFAVHQADLREGILAARDTTLKAAPTAMGFSAEASGTPFYATLPFWFIVGAALGILTYLLVDFLLRRKGH